jgi:shikimate kinase
VVQPNIVLIGFMGAGKSATAKRLSSLFSEYTMVDLDSEIEIEEKKSISDIFNDSGESYFRDLESNCLTRVSKSSSQIISTGGGVVLREKNRTLLREMGVVFWLVASPEVTVERIKDEAHRPLIASHQTESSMIVDVEKMIESRFESYKAVPHVILNTDTKSIDDVALDIKVEYERLVKCLE